MFLIIFIFPALALCVQLGFVFYAKQKNLPKPSTEILTIKSFKYGFIGAGLSLLHTIAWMYWYEYSTGFSAGNAPALWILFYGPVSFAIGQIVALFKWWRSHAI